MRATRNAARLTLISRSGETPANPRPLNLGVPDASPILP